MKLSEPLARTESASASSSSDRRLRCASASRWWKWLLPRLLARRVHRELQISGNGRAVRVMSMWCPRHRRWNRLRHPLLLQPQLLLPLDLSPQLLLLLLHLYHILPLPRIVERGRLPLVLLPALRQVLHRLAVLQLRVLRVLHGLRLRRHAGLPWR